MLPSWKCIVPKTVEPGAVPLLMVHGFACGQDDWGVLPRLLATKAKREVLVFDNRGVGLTAHPEGPYTVAQLAQDAMAVADAAGVDKVSVLGISLGGLVAQQVAIDFPQRTQALVLGCTTHGGREATPNPPAFLATCAAWVQDLNPNSSPHVDAFMRACLPTQGDEEAAAVDPVLWAQFKEHFGKTARTQVGLQGQMAAMGRFNSSKSLPTFNVPTLVVTGDCDGAVPAANSQSLARRIPGAKLVEWAGAGHFFWATEPAECAAVLARFLLESDSPELVGSRSFK
jgi:3-oxoadipate enol-lactonase